MRRLTGAARQIHACGDVGDGPASVVAQQIDDLLVELVEFHVRRHDGKATDSLRRAQNLGCQSPPERSKSGVSGPKTAN